MRNPVDIYSSCPCVGGLKRVMLTRPLCDRERWQSQSFAAANRCKVPGPGGGGAAATNSSIYCFIII